MNAENFLSQEQVKQVEEAVAAAERRTSAEFLCAVATESGNYDRAESIVGLAFGLLGLVLVRMVDTGLFGWEIGSWSGTRQLSTGWMALGVVLGFALGTWLAERFQGLRHPFISEAHQEHEVERSAAYVFSLHRLGHTRQRVGVLLYISLFERKVAILADQASLETLTQQGVEQLRDLAVSRLKEDKRAEAVIDTIHDAAARLEEAHPCADDDQDELPNQLVFFHPRP